MAQSPPHVPTTRIVEPSMRVNALFQIALNISMSRADRALTDLRLTLGAVRDGAYQPSLTFANGDFDLAMAVARGEVDLAAINPSAFLSMAYRGTGPYPEPLPVRVIAVMPSLDVMLFAVSKRTGVSSLADVLERRYPLRVSVRRSSAHGTRFVTDQVLAALGCSLADIEAWGGSVHYADSPTDEKRLAGVRSREIDAVFDEGVRGWAPLARDSGMRFIDLDEPARRALKAVGWAVVPVRTALPEVESDIMAPSFSGWPLFTREGLSEDLAYRMCQALEEAGERMVWDSDEPVTTADWRGGKAATPNDVPLHPGADRYYRERSFLPR